MKHFDAIVIGLGALGAATFHQLAKRGTRVLGLDQYQPPHSLGSSHGESRITRLAIGEGDEYVPLVHRSHEIWRELEARTGRSLLTTTGGLVLAPRDRIAAHHGKPDFVRRTIDVAKRHGIVHEVLDTAGIRARYPQFHLQGDEFAYWERDAGLVRPEEAIAAQLETGRADGGTLQLNEKVLALENTASGDVLVRTDRAQYTAAQVVVTAGPWLPGFLSAHLPRAGLHRQLEVYRQVMYWFDARPQAAEFAPGRFPVFIWMFGDAQEDYMYGFPAADTAAPALKVATEQYSVTTSPAAVDREVAADEIEAMYKSRVAERFPQLSGHALQARACLYTVTPDRHFVIDTLEGAPGVTVVSACSGHGFKHSAGLGEAIAQKLRGEPGGASLKAFGRARLDAPATSAASAR